MTSLAAVAEKVPTLASAINDVAVRKFFRRLAKKYNLLLSGGSDCHGYLNGGPYIGKTKIPYRYLQRMKNRFGKK